MSLETSYDLSRINQKRPDNMLVQLNKMQAQLEEMYAAIAAGANTTETDLNSHINNTSNPHSVTKTQVGLGNVDNYATASQAEAEAGTATDKFMTPQRSKQAIDKQIKGTSWTQENGLYIATDQLRARDSSGLILNDDGGNGLTIADGGNVTQTSGKYIATDEIRATDSGGLILHDDGGNGLTILDGGNTSLTAGKYHSTDSIRALGASGLGLYDDSGQGPKVNDGGIVTNAYQPGFSAYVTSTQSNVTGDSTIYSLNTSIWSEKSDIGNNFSAGVFTAPIASTKYYFNVNMYLQGLTTSHTEILIALVTTGGQLRSAITHGNAASGTGDIILSTMYTNVTMSASDTAYILLRVSGSTKVVDVGAVYTTYSGGLMP